MLDVVKIMLNLDARIIGIGSITVHHLRPATDPRTHYMAIHIKGDLPLELVDKGTLFRPRPNQAHVPLEDIEELRQLIDAQLADHLAHAGDTHVTVLGELSSSLFRVLAHAAELIDTKIFIPLADTILQEHHGTRALQLYQHSRYQHQW
ncbi:hypothetical protein D3C79_685870 [compost metagenome]